MPDYLRHSGKRLKKLKLKYTETANLRVTEIECPKLEKLKLRGNGTPSVESSVVRSLSLGVVTAEGKFKPSFFGLIELKLVLFLQRRVKIP